MEAVAGVLVGCVRTPAGDARDLLVDLPLPAYVERAWRTVVIMLGEPVCELVAAGRAAVHGSRHRSSLEGSAEQAPATMPAMPTTTLNPARAQRTRTSSSTYMFPAYASDPRLANRGPKPRRSRVESRGVSRG